MKNSYLKKISLVLALTMGLSSLAGCSSDSSSSSSSSTADTTETVESTADAAEEVVEDDGNYVDGFLVPEETRTFRVMMYDRGYVDGEYSTEYNPSTIYIEETFGELYNCEIEWVLVSRTEADDLLNVMMAAGSAPDICFSYDRDLVYQYASQGGLTNLTEYYDQAEYLQVLCGDAMDSCMYDGEVVSIPAIRSIVAQHSTSIRTDYLEEVDMDLPTTTEEWYDCMVAFKEAGLIDYPVLIKNTDKFQELSTLLWSFVDADLSEKDDYTLPWLSLPGWEDGVEFLNQMYNEGLIDPEFALDQNNTLYNQRLSSGDFASGTDLTAVFSTNSEILSAYSFEPDMRIAIIEPFTDSEGVANHPVYSEVGMYNFCPVTSSDNADLVVAYLNWMADAEDGLRLQKGIEGIQWAWADGEVGSYYIGQDAIAEEDRADGWEDWVNEDGSNRRSWTGSDLYPLTSSTYDTPEAYILTREVTAAVTGANTVDEETGGEYLSAITREAIELSMTNPFIDVRENPDYDTVFSTVSTYQTNLNDIYTDGLVKCITCSPEDFEATYASVVAEYLNAGGQAIIDEKTAYYEANFE
ncbi:MAG: extracellular solute-binding protein [Lachnospiraceae bacterium]